MSLHPIKYCLQCGEIFRKSKPSITAKKKFCTAICCQRYQKGPNNPNWRGGGKDAKCQACGVIVAVSHALAKTFKYCSKACFDSSQRGDKSVCWKGGKRESQKRLALEKRVKRQEKKALVNEKPLKIKIRLCLACGGGGLTRSRKFHSSCRPASICLRLEVSCQDCGAKRICTERAGRHPVRCSSCDLKSRKGENNANWKGGITPSYKKARKSPEYLAWRQAVFERDKFTCVFCGQYGGSLNADHIKPFAFFPELRTELSNGRTLCVPCHKNTDTYLGKGRKQYRDLETRKSELLND